MSGADVIATASYQLNIDLIQKDLKCSYEEARELIKKSVKIAKEALQESKCGSLKSDFLYFIKN